MTENIIQVVMHVVSIANIITGQNRMNEAQFDTGNSSAFPQQQTTGFVSV